MSERYNIYFAGQVLEGRDTASVRDAMGKLFKADAATLDKLFSGKAQLLKRECDKATALKYKQAMEKAGAKPLIKRIATAEAAAPAPEESRPLTAAERIAAVAAGRDPDSPADAQPPSGDTSEEAAEEEVPEGLYLCAPGADLLRPEERKQPGTVAIDTSSLDIDASGGRLSEPAPTPPPAPDTAHMTMGEVGESIPTLQTDPPPPAPDISAIDLSPEGTDFSDCAPPPAFSEDLDLSHLDIAETGSDMLEAAYRKENTATAPDTDHIKLSD